MPEFIGEREIKSFEADRGGEFINIEFIDGYKTTMNGTVFFHVKADKETPGTVTDKVNHYFASKFIAELAEAELDYYFVSSIGTAMSVFAHNLREDAIRKAFQCSGGDAIPLQKLMPEDSAEQEIAVDVAVTE